MPASDARAGLIFPAPRPPAARLCWTPCAPSLSAAPCRCPALQGLLLDLQAAAEAPRTGSGGGADTPDAGAAPRGEAAAGDASWLPYPVSDSSLGSAGAWSPASGRLDTFEGSIAAPGGAAAPRSAPGPQAAAASGSGGDPEAAAAALRAAVNARDRRGRTPLHAAAKRGNAGCVRCGWLPEGGFHRDFHRASGGQGFEVRLFRYWHTPAKRHQAAFTSTRAHGAPFHALSPPHTPQCPAVDGLGRPLHRRRVRLHLVSNPPLVLACCRRAARPRLAGLPASHPSAVGGRQTCIHGA
jgi:hypothetical protein